MGRKYDVVIFGASGFTGKFVIEAAIELLRKKDDNETFTYAVAGRSDSKLRQVLEEVSARTGEDLSGVARIIADVASTKSLHDMASQCHAVINCVGPYRFFGEQIVKACIAEGTHHVDVSGEPQYLERMQSLYHKEAELKGVYIVGSCGLDSIPADCGVTYLQKNFDGDVNSVEMYLETDCHGTKPGIHFATWQSAIYGLAHAGELRPLRKALFPEPMPKPKYPIEQRGVLHYSDVVKGWCLPFPGSDRSVVKRSQYYFFRQEKKRPAQMTAYFKTSGLFTALIMMFVASVFGVLAQFRIGRYLLEKYPKLFSFGLVSHEGPSVESMKATEFKMTLKGEGWNQKLAEPTDQHSEPPNKKLNVIVSGFNPGYGLTAHMVLRAALTVIRETDKLPSKGGVYPPGAAFSNTKLIEKLNKVGAQFTVQSV